MIEKILGAMIGGAIDKSDGEGGLKGALLGMVLPGLMRRMGRFGWILGGLVALFSFLSGRGKRSGGKREAHDGRRAARAQTARRPSVRHLR